MTNYNSKMILREYNKNDIESVSKLFYDTVHEINKKDYSEIQLNAWANGKVDLEKWNESFLKHYTVIAELDGETVGFGDIDDSGYLDRLYVHKDYQHIGIGSALCDMLENHVQAEKIITHSSITAKSFFESRGYKVVKNRA